MLLLLYNSTRDKNIKVSAAQAIAQGISTDEGLFVPEEIPKYSLDIFKEMSKYNYNEIAEKVFSDYLTDFTQEEISYCVKNAYNTNNFSGSEPVSIINTKYDDSNINILELWHGPTSAFKDMALQVLPYFLTEALNKTNKDKTAVILVATSGDTGKAALEGFKDVKNIEIITFYPEKGVSPMQKLQMDTQEGNNVNVCAIKGNFDDAQTGVKNIFTSKETVKKLNDNNMMFSSANSINWGRLLPQIVYYIYSYCNMVNNKEIELGDKINIVVPTGNFGNILASYYAMLMGLPVNKFICASNSNKVLTDFINTGTYDRKREFHTTISPSMDILVSSNLERLLYHLSDNKDATVKSLMEQLKNKGVYTVDNNIKEKIDKYFYGGFCSEKDTKETIKKLYKESNYLCDTHTAVAVNVYNKYVKDTKDTTPVIIASTASPYKFSKAVLEAIKPEDNPNINEFEIMNKLNSITKVSIPKPLSDIEGKKIRFNNVVKTEDMSSFVLNSLEIK